MYLLTYLANNRLNWFGLELVRKDFNEWTVKLQKKKKWELVHWNKTDTHGTYDILSAYV